MRERYEGLFLGAICGWLAAPNEYVWWEDITMAFCAGIGAVLGSAVVRWTYYRLRGQSA